MATEKMADDFESLIKDIACAHRIPHAAMAQAMAHAGALFPRIEALAKRRIAGEWLYPAEENLLLAGLCVLAAAKERAIWPVWLDLITLPDADLEECLGEDCVQTIAAVTLGLVDADVGAIAALVSERRTDADACCALVSVLARLMCEGRYERGAFVEMIDGLAALAHEDKDAFAAPNLEQAILLGGIAERADLLEQIWQADTEGFWREVDRIDARKRLKAAAANPADLRRFDEEGVAAPREPGEAMRWLSRADARRAPERPEAAPLSWREREAFAAFLTRAGAMTFEELDGFVHSLVLGPDLVAPSECFPRIWGKDEPVFEDTDDADRILALLQRHWNSVVQCGLDGDRPRPWLEAQPAFKPGQVWARGFLTGVMMRDALWDAAGEESGAALGLAAILRLGGDEIDEEERRDRLYDLPYDIAGIDRYWRELREEEMRAERAPVRVEKVGRNAPCPCGSGKKWKKCCGAGETAH